MSKENKGMGEESNFMIKVATFIVDRRKEKPLETTGELSEIIKAAIPQKARKDEAHPEKRVFQAREKLKSF